MEPHPIPRQITTFEFKLIGFLTLKQFIYLVIFIPLGVIVFFLIPVPFLNFLIALPVGALGPMMAFLSFNERGLDIWIKNFIKKLFSPSQFYYQKKNLPPPFLKEIVITTSPQIVNNFIDARQKLSFYLSQKNPPKPPSKTQTIHELLTSPLSQIKKPPQSVSSKPEQLTQPKTANIFDAKTPFFVGIVKNHKDITIPNVLVYVKNEKGELVRLLKTNSHGVFATFQPLSAGNYFFEIKDPEGRFVFDTMKIEIKQKNDQPFIFYSKEIL